MSYDSCLYLSPPLILNQAAHKMTRFPPSTCVLRSVRMTRTAYAQLTGQKFYPPKIFGRWEEREGTPEWRWKDVGMKIVSPPKVLEDLAEIDDICRLLDLKCFIKRARDVKACLRSNFDPQSVLH